MQGLMWSPPRIVKMALSPVRGPSENPWTMLDEGTDRAFLRNRDAVHLNTGVAGCRLADGDVVHGKDARGILPPWTTPAPPAAGRTRARHNRRHERGPAVGGPGGRRCQGECRRRLQTSRRRQTSCSSLHGIHSDGSHPGPRLRSQVRPASQRLRPERSIPGHAHSCRPRGGKRRPNCPASGAHDGRRTPARPGYRNRGPAGKAQPPAMNQRLSAERSSRGRFTAQ